MFAIVFCRSSVLFFQALRQPFEMDPGSIFERSFSSRDDFSFFSRMNPYPHFREIFAGCTVWNFGTLKDQRKSLFWELFRVLQEEHLIPPLTPSPILTPLSSVILSILVTGWVFLFTATGVLRRCHPTTLLNSLVLRRRVFGVGDSETELPSAGPEHAF